MRVRYAVKKLACTSREAIHSKPVLFIIAFRMLMQQSVDTQRKQLIGFAVDLVALHITKIHACFKQLRTDNHTLNIRQVRELRVDCRGNVLHMNIAKPAHAARHYINDLTQNRQYMQTRMQKQDVHFVGISEELQNAITVVNGLNPERKSRPLCAVLKDALCILSVLKEL